MTQEPRFRLLTICGPGIGVSSLINAVFKASLVDARHQTDIKQEIISEDNRSLILHDAGGYEPRNEEKFGILKKFIQERCREGLRVSERLDAIWLCIAVPSNGDAIFEPGNEQIFKLDRNKVPLIVVFVEFDLFKVQDVSQESTEKNFKEKYGQEIEKMSRSIRGPITHTLVEISRPESLWQLIKLTMNSIQGHSSRENSSSSIRIALATAQRIDLEGRITKSIRIGKDKFPKAFNKIRFNLLTCLGTMHRDIVNIWDIRDLNEFLLSDRFRDQVMAMVDDLSDGNAGATGRIKRKNSWSGSDPINPQCIWSYVAILVVILLAIFQIDRLEGNVNKDRVIEIFYEFYYSGKKTNINFAIRELVTASSRKQSIMDKIELFVLQNRNMQLNYNRPPLPSLLTVLAMELAVFGELRIKGTSLTFFRKLLDPLDYVTIIESVDDTDTKLLLDYILKVLRDGILLNSGIIDGNRKARKLMFKLVKHKAVMPSSLFLKNVTKCSNVVAIGGFGYVSEGEFDGTQVALKELHKVHNDYGFYREAITWHSLSHRYILPLLGIYEKESKLCLVSPFMKSGTLTKWRETQQPSMTEIRKRMLEVAEAVQFIHSEGIFHGDLRGANVLLNSDCHCQITDFGLSRHVDITASQSATDWSIHFAAPELFGTCDQCGQGACDGCKENKGKWRRNRSLETDVYAFGCLYYTTYFGTVPYRKKTEHQITRLVTTGVHPDRLQSPRMTDKEWNMIEGCWAFKSSERPTMRQVMTIISSLIWDSSSYYPQLSH